MSLPINETALNFEAEPHPGKIKFHLWIEDSRAMLFSHPKDFTPPSVLELRGLLKTQKAEENAQGH